MASEARSSEIARAVRRLLARGETHGQSPVAVIRPVARSAMVGGLALLTLAPAAVQAVGLGEARTTSALGQPLRATVPMRLGSGETLRPGCVTTPARQGADLRSPAGTRVKSPAKTGPGIAQLEVTSRQPLYEPLYELTLKVDCPGLPKVMRHYVLLLDLPGLAMPSRPSVAAPPRRQDMPATSARTPKPALTPRRTTPLTPTRAPIPAGKSYRVREGDTLSTIAARIEGRAPNTTWQVAERIFAANPQAFIGNNPDLIKLGARITIPDTALAADAAATAETAETAVPESAVLPPTLLPPAVAPATESTAPAPTPAAEQAIEDLAIPPAATPLLEVELTVDALPVDTQVSLPGTTENAGGAEEIPLAPATPDNLVADEVAPAPIDAAAEAAEPPPLTMAPRESGRASPLFAVMLGLLLGLGLSILLLRSRLLEGLSKLFMRKKPRPGPKTAESAYADTDDWLKTDEGLHAEPVVLGSPAEPTYIIEIEEQEETASDVETPVAERTTDFDAPVATPEKQVDADAVEAIEVGATADTPQPVETPDVASQTAADLPQLTDPGATLETAEMPRVGETGETVAMPEANYDPTVEPDLAELFADDLLDLPAEPDLPVEIFADQEPDGEASPVAPTARMPAFEDSQEPFDEDPTLGSAASSLEGLTAGDAQANELPDLQGLSDDDALDESGLTLTATLHDAMSLLEEEFSGELTASQIVDRSGLKRLMEDDEAGEAFDEPELEQPVKKRAG